MHSYISRRCIDLATDTSHGTIGVYTSGVYCTAASSAASIGAGGITLSGGGTYIFRITGALTTVANSVVTLAGGASACDLFWTPTAATTLGANTTFAGTNIDAAGITIGSTVTWTGRALAFGGTVSTDVDTITVPSCAGATNAAGGSVLTNSGSSSSSGGSSSNTACPAFNYVAPVIIESKRISPTSIFISWGPYSGVNTFNIRYGLINGNWLYNTRITGFSTTINDLPPNQPIWFQVAATNNCSIGNYGEAMLAGGPNLPNGPLLPNTGTGSRDNNNLLNIIILTGIVMSALASFVVAFKKRTN